MIKVRISHLDKSRRSHSGKESGKLKKSFSEYFSFLLFFFVSFVFDFKPEGKTFLMRNFISFRIHLREKEKKDHQYNQSKLDKLLNQALVFSEAL